MTVVADSLYDAGADKHGEHDEEDRHHETRKRVGRYDQCSYGKTANHDPLP
jgi:hypothetical protein